MAAVQRARKVIVGLMVLGSVAACRLNTDSSKPKASEPGIVAVSDGALDSELERIFAGSDLPPTNEQPLHGDAMQATVHRLSNGMTVYLSVDRQRPRFTAWIGVRAGSRMDPAASTGLAHYLEHMLFKGSDEYGTLDPSKEAPHVEAVRELYAKLRTTPDAKGRAAVLKQIDHHTQQMAKYAVPNEFSRMFSSLGVEGINAYTSLEETVYIGDVPANRLEQWATVESERFSDPVFRLFYPELEAVYEEKNLSLDRPQSRGFQAMMESLFSRHPYGTQTTIGSPEHLKTPAYQDMSDYFDKWYVPNNMAIVLTGDLDPKRTIEVLEAKFARLSAKPVPTAEPGALPPLKGRIERQVRGEGRQNVSLAWHTAPVGHEDVPAVELMDRLLDDASVGLINTQLELTQKIPSGGSWHSTMNEAGFFSVYARLRNDQSPVEVEALLLGVLDQLKRGEFTQADLDAAKLHKSIDDKNALEHSVARASRLMEAFISHRDWSDVVAEDEAFAKVTRDDVIRVANKYLGKNFVAVHRIKGKYDVPQLDKPEITPVEIDPSRKSEFAQRIEAMEVPQLEPQWAVEGKHYEHRALPAGKLIAAKNVRNDLFSLSYQVKRGSRKEPLLCTALELMELSGTQGRSAEQLHKELYALGSSVTTGCSADYSSVSISGVDHNMEATLTLVRGWMREVAIDKGALTRLRDTTISARRDTLESDRALTSALDAYAKYAKRSPHLAVPSNRALSKASPKALRELVGTALDYAHVTSYFGPRSAAAVGSVVAATETSAGSTTFVDPGDVPVREYRDTKGPRIYFVHKAGAKANVRFVIPQPPLQREQRPIAKLYSEYLSGSMSSLVFQEIRESRGLAYSAYSTYSQGRTMKDASGLLGFMSTQADKTPVAVSTFLELLRGRDIQPDRLKIAKMAIEQEYRASRIDPRWISAWVDSWDELGEPGDPRAREWATIRAADAAQVGGFAGGFAEAPVLIAVVGDRDRVGLEELRKLGQVIELRPEELFNFGRFPRANKTSAR